LFIEKAVRIAVEDGDIPLRGRRKAGKHLNPNIEIPPQILQLLLLAMILQEFGVEIAPILAAAELWDWHRFWRNNT
jgi:hypothetical protein